MNRVKTIKQTGFEISDHVLNSTECDDLLLKLTASKALRSRAGARHLISMPFIAHIANDERMQAIASAALGSNAVPFRVTLFDKSADSNWSVAWHQDRALPLEKKFESEGWSSWSIKAGIVYALAPKAALNRIVALRVHLDDSTMSNGPLRVLPGTHRLGVLSEGAVAEVARTVAAVVCLVPKGGVLAMRPLLIHASSRMAEPAHRRVLHIEYTEDREVVPGIKLASA